MAPETPKLSDNIAELEKDVNALDLGDTNKSSKDKIDPLKERGKKLKESIQTTEKIDAIKDTKLKLDSLKDAVSLKLEQMEGGDRDTVSTLMELKTDIDEAHDDVMKKLAKEEKPQPKPTDKPLSAPEKASGVLRKAQMIMASQDKTMPMNLNIKDVVEVAGDAMAMKGIQAELEKEEVTVPVISKILEGIEQAEALSSPPLKPEEQAKVDLLKQALRAGAKLKMQEDPLLGIYPKEGDKPFLERIPALFKKALITIQKFLGTIMPIFSKLPQNMTGGIAPEIGNVAIFSELANSFDGVKVMNMGTTANVLLEKRGIAVVTTSRDATAKARIDAQLQQRKAAEPGLTLDTLTQQIVQNYIDENRAALPAVGTKEKSYISLEGILNNQRPTEEKKGYLTGTPKAPENKPA